ncbi:MAG: hypothetical protein NXI31_09905 [bacterium]|nr:hypothetical protein [bacterium]
MTASLNWIRAGLVALTAGGLAAQKTPEEALRALSEGNRRFAAERSVPQPVGEGVRRTLARGQNPIAVVLCCTDSRVPPEHVFNCGLGELFVIRVAGNTCDRETLASIEYAVEHLNVPLCVILGHEGCCAISATIDQVQSIDNDHQRAAPSPAIQHLIEQIEPAVRKARGRDLGGKALHDACEEENVHLTLHEALRRSPLLRRYVQVGRLQMVGARYHLQSGEVEWLPHRPLPPEPRFDFDPAEHNVPVAVPPHVALRMLQAGHRRFLGDSLPAGDLSAERREALTHGEQPLAIVLTGADSRVAPEHVFDSGLGELLVIRVAGGVVTENVLASIEQAASRTGASLLIVMGHTRCDTMAAAANQPADKEMSPNMRALLARLEPSVAAARQGGKASIETIVERAVTANVHRTVQEVRSRSSILRELEHRGRFAVLPTVYDVASGNLTWLKEQAATGDQPAAAAPHGETGGHGHGDGAHGHDSHGHDSHGHESHGDHGHSTHGNGHGHGHEKPAHGDHGHEAHGDHHDHHDHGDHPAPAGESKATAKMPVLDWGDAVVSGDTHGHDSHGQDPHGHTDHGHSGHSHETQGHEAHRHGSGHHDSDAQDPGHHADTGHGTPHGETGHGHDSHGHDGDAHDHGAHAESHGHGDHGHDDGHGSDHSHEINPPRRKHYASPWQDPIVIVGMAGVTSLLLAAGIALLKR